MGTPSGWLFDIEADGLYLQSTKIWYIRLTALDGSRTLCVKPFEIGNEAAKSVVMDWVNSFDDGSLVVAHNGLGYDVWMLWKILGITPRVGKGGKDFLGGKHVQYIDTFVLSMYLHPNQQSHSLAFLSSGNDNTKMEYREQLVSLGAMQEDDKKGHEFSFYHPLMDKYCDTDVLALKDVFSYLWRCGEQMYGEEWLHSSFRQMQKDYWLFSAQAFTGVKFDIEAAKSLITTIDNEMLILKNEVDPLLPPRALKGAEEAYYKMPAKPFTLAGEHSATLIKWLSKMDATLVDGVIYAKGISAPLVANSIFPIKLPMEIDDNTELKNYFLESGWKPSDDHWNFKKDENNKPVRDERGKLIRTTPKIQHQGNICPNLLKIEGEIPKKVVKFLSLRNRKGVVEGWLNNWRLAFDGRLSAEISGYAPTSRVKHRTVVNCPKADVKVLLGKEMRSLFCVDDGHWYIGTDAAALENRTLSHYTYKYDNGFFADLNLNKDIHTSNSFAFFPHLKEQFNQDDTELSENPLFKPWRNKAKTGAYLLAFGGGAAKLASSLGLSKKEGEEAYNNYWETNLGLGKLKEAIEKYFSTEGKNRHIPAIDGRLVSVRGKNVLLSCLGQGLGAISMSYASCIMDNVLGELYIDSLGRPYYKYKGKVVKRVSHFHDEYSWEVEDGIQDDILSLTENAIIKAGEILNLSIPLAAKGKMAYNGTWCDVH